jgi:hypothetical protein
VETILSRHSPNQCKKNEIKRPRREDNAPGLRGEKRELAKNTNKIARTTINPKPQRAAHTEGCASYKQNTTKVLRWALSHWNETLAKKWRMRGQVDT